jgi:NAD+ synthase
VSNWLKNYADCCNTDGFLIGISGGIDSAVTSILAAKTKLPVICVELPIYQNEAQAERGIQHIKWLKKKFSNVSSIKLDLTSVLDELVKKIDDDSKNELALANTRARLRMTALYYFAQSNNSLVLGTGNKVEDFGIGFFTKYGDGGVDISPIADLLKSEVYILAKYLNVNKAILTAPPTDGLWECDKTDEDQIGASYNELEWAMQFKGDEDLLSKREKEVLHIYKHLNHMNQHKMKEIPVCIIPKDLK